MLSYSELLSGECIVVTLTSTENNK